MSYDLKDTEAEVQHFKKIAESLIELKSAKANDYGNSWRIFGLAGIIYQIGSKFIRIWNIHQRGVKTRNEPLKDSFRDIAVYAIMAMQLLEEGNTDDAFTEFGKQSFAESASKGHFAGQITNIKIKESAIPTMGSRMNDAEQEE